MYSLNVSSQYTSQAVIVLITHTANVLFSINVVDVIVVVDTVVWFDNYSVIRLPRRVIKFSSVILQFIIFFHKYIQKDK